VSDPCYGERFEQALCLAARSFRKVRRKATGVPYIAHLLWVTATVAEHGGDEDQLIAAVLHDYLEDVEGSSVEQLERQFGQRVAWMVAELSDTTTRPKPPWRQRKERYLAHLPHADPAIKLVSAADKLHNVLSCVHDYQDSGEELFDRFRGGREGTLWYFREVHRALAEGWDHPIVPLLGEQVVYLHELASARYPDA
jgi:(p)ppGpp synthase/HD superfamily hydrolase